MQDFDVFCSESLFLLSALLRVPRQGINSSVSFALTIINSAMVTREFLDPADLPGAQTLRVHQPSEVVMVGKYEEFMLKAL